MNAVLRHAQRLEKMTAAHLDEVMAIENEAYPFPWTRGNFIDSLASGYPAQVLFDSDRRGHVIGYFVAMEGVDELHLLNLTVAPAAQGQGSAASCSTRWSICAGNAVRCSCGSKCGRATGVRTRCTGATAFATSACGVVTTRLRLVGAKTRW